MSQIIPYASQLRFHRASTQIDFINNLPTPDLMRLREQYQRGIYPISYYPDHSINVPLSIEIVDSNLLSANLINEDSGASSSMSIINATPSGWISTNIWTVNATPTIEGSYRIDVVTTDSGVIFSDSFIVKDWNKTKDLVKVRFSDTLNRNGGVYYDGTTKKWEPVVYYTGNIEDTDAEFEKSVYNDEPNNTRNLLTTPKFKSLLTITSISKLYYSKITTQFSCDEIFVNNTQYAFEDMSTDKTDQSDVIDVIITLSRNNNNGFQQI